MTDRYHPAVAQAIACPRCPGLWTVSGVRLEFSTNPQGWTKGWTVYQCDRCRNRWAPALRLLHLGARQAAARLLIRGQR